MSASALVTIRRGGGSVDVELPGDGPVRELLPALVLLLGDDLELADVAELAPPDGAVISGDETLDTAEVLDGTILIADAKTPDRSPTAAPVEGALPARQRLSIDVAGQHFEFTAGSTVSIGRAPDSDVHLTSQTVSRRHAEVRPDGDAWMLRDVGSLNGTFLDGVQVGAIPLGARTEVSLGSPTDGVQLILSTDGTAQGD